jgi:hypothetical protein
LYNSSLADISAPLIIRSASDFASLITFLDAFSLLTWRNRKNKKHIKKPKTMQTGSIGKYINGFEVM